MLLFKNIKGENIDTVNHTLEIMKSYPYAEIHIGNLMQNKNRFLKINLEDCSYIFDPINKFC